MDKFLDETHKKSVGDEIRRCNKEKKLPSANNFASTSSLSKSNKSRHPISNLPEDLEEKRKHIIGSTLYPLCNGDHKEESLWNDIRGEWGAGEYRGERTYRITCKNPLNHGIPIVSVKV
ncbi:hypothetical protein RhiirA4_456251 [Rhizophagus irregularis]|uniref:Uncharacterized protein n=1 Tax=Rhizophagus irregularis TaxID=588596 RepID=A0A2I1G719_9GLOM|nr:hypothetical protein RhiirA4_456251 [Rhizophagus irregularis]